MAAGDILRENCTFTARTGARSAFLLAAWLLAAACGGSDTPTSPTPPTTPTTPTLTCPESVSGTSAAGLPVTVPYTVPTATGGAAPVTVSCTPPPGTSFPIGTTSVTCTATASNGATGSCIFTVNISPPPASPRIQRTRFLAFGDSLTAGEITAPGSTTRGEGDGWMPLIIVPQASYPTQLEMSLRARYIDQSASLGVTNAGRAGEYATESARRFNEVLAGLRPEVVLILDGANDLGLGTPNALAQAAAAVESMAKEARFRGTRVFIGTLPPPGPGPRGLSRSTVQAYNARLFEVARGEGAAVVDLFTALSSTVSTDVGVDGLHLTESGYRRVADAFFQVLRQELEVR